MSTLLLYVPVRLYHADGVPYCEKQACNGLRLWAENFDRILLLLSTSPDPPPKSHVPMSESGADAMARIEIHCVPAAYTPFAFLRLRAAKRPLIRSLIERADYLCFAIGGYIGDWGAVACLEAAALGRPYAVWTDRVESEVVRREAESGPFKRRLKAALTHRPMRRLERRVISQSALGLFHGLDTYEAYAGYCVRPEVVHNIHLSPQARIEPARLAAKQARVGSGPLRIVYVGRSDAMKGPLDWIEAIAAATRAGVELRASWLGEGELQDELEARASALGVTDRVEFPGFLSDQTAVLEALREADLFLFCHKTKESPRCLIEALVSGCPIVGFESAFARDLIREHGGGVLTPLDDVEALAASIVRLDADRATLADLMDRAARDGAPFNDVDVFRHRSDLIKRYL